MRVIAGIAGGRKLVSPRGRGTRPTADRVKEALFSSLAPLLADASVLDGYAGSGGLGIEALSRGARHATFVERDGRALAAIRENLQTTGLAERASVVASDIASLLAGAAAPGAPFDVALLDPPYDTETHLLRGVLAALVGHLADGATVVLELGVRSPEPPLPAAMTVERTRKYGDTLLYVIRSTAGPAPDEEPPA